MNQYENSKWKPNKDIPDSYMQLLTKNNSHPELHSSNMQSLCKMGINTGSMESFNKETDAQTETKTSHVTVTLTSATMNDS